jgi:hypothetical protein
MILELSEYNLIQSLLFTPNTISFHALSLVHEIWTPLKRIEV